MANGAVVAEGFDLATLDTALPQLTPGESYTLRLYTEVSVSPDQMALIRGELERQGVEVKSIAQDAGILAITFVEPEPQPGIGFIFLPILAVAGTVGAGWFGWQITKEVKETTQQIPKAAWYIGVAVVLAGGLYIAYRLLKPKTKRLKS